MKSETKEMKESNVKNKTLFNNKLERSDQKSNTNTSAEMKISQKVKQDTCSKGNSSQTVDIEKKTNKEKEKSKNKTYLEIN